MLEIKNLFVECEGKQILKGINLKLKTGEVHAIMGPNGSGKTTLAYILMGNPKYKIVKGEILLNKKNITSFRPEELAKEGIFLSFQNPLEISGVTISSFLRQAYNSINKQKLSVFEFRELIKEKAKVLGLNQSFLNLNLNKGLSGGEKKKSEILQMLVLNPRIVILDETDSGLDIDSLKIVSKGIKNFIEEDKENKKALLVITHYKRILDYINPHKISVMMGGKIVVEGDNSLVDVLEKKGYSWIKTQ